MINNKKYACPECQSHGLIAITEDDKLCCGNCGNQYTEEETLDKTSTDSFGETDNV